MMESLEIIMIIIFIIITFPAGLISNIVDLLPLPISPIITTWFIYLLIFLAVLSRKSISPKKKIIFIILYIAYIVTMILVVEKYLGSSLNLTEQTPIYMPATM